ncbi:hypothetical protein ACFFVB_02475 [Formosa undariae]|uniref:DUF4625 domain-containing protein n=1 Tax=Formosa undariae TaxID=1325436 RepID=A0ABV5EXT0_9FLAO
MKKLLLLFVAALTLASCDTDDDYSSNFTYGVLPTEVADIPEGMEVGKIYRITVDYIRPTDCYSFYTLDYKRSTEDIEDASGELIDTQVRTIAVINRIFIEDDCEELDVTTQVYFDFEPISEGPYVFRFWVGEDEDGEDIFLEYETVVLE